MEELCIGGRIDEWMEGWIGGWMEELCVQVGRWTDEHNLPFRPSFLAATFILSSAWNSHIMLSISSTLLNKHVILHHKPHTPILT